jgi:hypothetical protein
VDFRERQYVISPEVLQDEKVRRLAERALEATRGFRLNTEGLTEEWVESEGFRKLERREQVMAARAIKACLSGAEWALGSVRDESGLFAMDVPLMRVEAVEEDAKVLSGALGSMIRDFYAEDHDGNSIWGGTGRAGSLEDLKLLGALVNQREPLLSAGAGFELADGGKKSMIYIGANMHGDFGMWQIDSAYDSSYSPGGGKEPFSPAVVKGVGAYHSVELDIVGSAMTHLASDYDDEKLRHLLDEIFQKLKMPSEAGAHPFGDYGSSEYKIRQNASLWREVHEGEGHPRRGGVIDSFMVSPANHNQALQMISGDDGLTFRQVEDIRQSNLEGTEIFIPDEKIPDLIAAIGSSDRGRTAPEEVLELLQLIYSSTLK